MEGNRIFANVVQASRKRPTEGCDFQGKFFGSSLSLKVLDKPMKNDVVDEICRNLNVHPLEFEQRSANHLSLNQAEQFTCEPEPGRYTPRAEAPAASLRTDQPVPARGNSIADPVGQPKFFSKPPQRIWRGDDEEPSTSGTDEFSSLPASQDDSKYVRRKYRSVHFGGFKSD